MQFGFGQSDLMRMYDRGFVEFAEFVQNLFFLFFFVSKDKSSNICQTIYFLKQLEKKKNGTMNIQWIAIEYVEHIYWPSSGRVIRDVSQLRPQLIEFIKSNEFIEYFFSVFSCNY